MKRMVFGLGCGRCGTKSLAYILNQQDGADVSHEADERMWYSKTRDPIASRNRIQKISQREGSLIGDIAFYNLWWWEEIIELCGDVKFVCIKRNKEDTVNSLVQKCGRRCRRNGLWRDYWSKEEFIEVNGVTYKRFGTTWSRCFPNMSGKTITDRAANYYDLYYELVEKIKGDVEVFDVEDLNSREGQDKIFDFLELPAKGRKYYLNMRIKDNARELDDADRNPDIVS